MKIARLTTKVAAKITQRLLIVIIAVLIALLSTVTGTQSVQAARFDAPVYGKPAPFAVGTTELIIQDQARALQVAVWYPALRQKGQPDTTIYSYGPLSTSALGIRDGEPDRSGGAYSLIVYSLR